MIDSYAGGGFAGYEPPKDLLKAFHLTSVLSQTGGPGW
jgi:hypothetical protein